MVIHILMKGDTRSQLQPPGIGPVSKAESDSETDLDQCACLKTYMSWIFNSLVTDVRSVVSGRPGLAHRAVQS